MTLAGPCIQYYEAPERPAPDRSASSSREAFQTKKEIQWIQQLVWWKLCHIRRCTSYGQLTSSQSGNPRSKCSQHRSRHDPRTQAPSQAPARCRTTLHPTRGSYPLAHRPLDSLLNAYPSFVVNASTLLSTPTLTKIQAPYCPKKLLQERSYLLIPSSHKSIIAINAVQPHQRSRRQDPSSGAYRR